MKKIALIVASMGVVAASQAVTWRMLTFPSGPQGANATAYTTLGMTVVPLTVGVPANGSNAVTLLTPNGYVLGNSQFGSIFWEYEVNNFTSPVNAITYSIAGQVLGDGKVLWQEQVYGIDGLGNEHWINDASGQIVNANLPNNGFGLNGSIALGQHGYNKLRVKKSFTLLTSTGPGVNYASVGRINQACVPEPASMAALGLGVVALLRRRSRR